MLLLNELDPSVPSVELMGFSDAVGPFYEFSRLEMRLVAVCDIFYC